MFGNTAYVYIGAAARIAFTLGLHSHVDVGSRHSLHGQADMRLFCTLYQLDLDVALCYGHPPAVGEEIIPGALRVPSEDVSSPYLIEGVMPTHGLSRYSVQAPTCPLGT